MPISNNNQIQPNFTEDEFKPIKIFLDHIVNIIKTKHGKIIKWKLEESDEPKSGIT